MINPLTLFNLIDSISQHVGSDSLFCFGFAMLSLFFGFFLPHYVFNPFRGVQQHRDYDDAVGNISLTPFKRQGSTTFSGALSKEIWNQIGQGDLQALEEALSPDYVNTDLSPKTSQQSLPQFHFSEANEAELQHLFEALFDSSESESAITKTTINHHHHEIEIEKEHD